MRLWKSSLILLGCALAGGCNSSGSKNKKLTVTVGPPAASVALQSTVQFTATVINATDTTVVWKVNDVVGGNSTVGTISTNGLYTAPAAVPNPTTVTVKAVSNANSSVSGTATVTLISGINISLAPTTATMGTGEMLTLTATLTGTTNNGINWFVATSATGTFTAGGSATLGTIPTMTTGGTVPGCAGTACGTGVFTAPATAPTGGSVVVKAESVVDTSRFALATLSIVTAATPTLTSVTPTHAAAGSVFQDFYLIGTNFLSTSKVLIGGSSVPTTLVSPTTLRARAPASVLASPGALTVVVQPQQGALTQTKQVNVDPVRPALVSALPESATAGTATVSYQFNGGYFGSGVTGEFEFQPRATSSPNSQQLQVTFGGADLAIPGLFPVDVNNPAATPPRSAVNIALQPDAVAHPPTVTKTIGTGILNQPVSVAVDTGLGIAAVVNGGANGANANSVSLVNLSTDSIMNPSIPVGVAPSAVAVDSERDLAVVANTGSNPPSVSVINLANNAVQTVTGVGTSPFGVGVDSIHGLALVALQSTNTATIIDLKTLPAALSPVPCNFTGTPSPTAVTCSSVGISTGPNPQVSVLPQLGWAIITPGGAGTLSVVDLARNAVVFTSTVNLTERGVAVNTETEKLLLADPQSSFVSVFSLQDQAVSGLNLGTGNVAVAVNPLTNTGVTVNQFTNLATVIDLQTPATLATVTVGTNPIAVAIDPATDQALVANQSDGTVSIINLNPGPATANPQILQMDPPFTMTSGSAQAITLIGSGFVPGAVVRLNETMTVAATVSANGRRITATIPASLLTQANRIVVDVANVPTGPFSNAENLVVIQPVTVGTGPQAVAIDPERNLAVVTNRVSNNISVVDLEPTHATYATVLSTFSVGTTPAGVAVLSRTGQAVVANEGSSTASIVDLTGVTATATVATGGQPRGVAINPDSGFAYVSNSVSKSLSAFTITGSGTPTPTTIAVGNKPGAIAIAPDLNFLLLADETDNDFLLFDITTPGTPILRNRIAGPQLPTGAVYDPVSQLFVGLSSLGNNLLIMNPTTSQVSSARVGINPTSVAYNFQSSTLLTVNSSSNTISVMDFPNRRVRSILSLAGSSQYAIDIHPRTNIAVLVDTANNRILLFPMPR